MIRFHWDRGPFPFVPRTRAGRLALAAGAAAFLLLALLLAAFLFALALAAGTVLALAAALRARRLRRDLRREPPGIVVPVEDITGTAGPRPDEGPAGKVIVLPPSGRDRFGH